MCVATNDAGVVERSVTLTLQSKWLHSLCQFYDHIISHMIYEQNVNIK